jgi:two-component system, OmpR family, sensor kinase
VASRLAVRTLRGRLVAGVLVLLALACATVGVVTYVHLRSVLTGQLNTELVQAGQQYSRCLHPPAHEDGAGGLFGAPGGSPPAGGGHHDIDNKAGQNSPADCTQQVQNYGILTAAISRGAVRHPYFAARGDTPDPCLLSAADKRELASLPPNGTPRAVELSGYGTYQMAAVRTPAGVYVTGLSLKPTDGTLSAVAMAELAVFGAALVLTGILGTAWVRLSLRPLRRVTATASRVAELPLAAGDVALPDRVPDADPRTEVGQVGAAFNRMLGHVEAALGRRAASEARLRRFAADASHELRTPLAAIRGYAELGRRDPGPVPETVAHALGRVESESARMSVLVDELLLLAQIDAGRPLASEPVDLTRLAIEVTSDARVAAPGHRWMLELPGEPVLVRGDDHRLHQVLANLLSNAAKHTSKGTTVTVALAAAPDSGTGSGPGMVEVSVTDDGPGIPAELQPALFERFVRGDSSRSRTAGSTGLGLAIVDAVATAHHGSAEVSSRPGRTRFVVRLPRLAGDGQEGEAAAPADDQARAPGPPDPPGRSTQTRSPSST